MIQIGIAAPLTSEVEVSSSTLDLTTVSAVAWEVARPGGEVVTWSASIVGAATPVKIVTRRAHVSGDVPRAGRYVVRVLLTTPGGIVRSVPSTFTAKGFP